MPNTPVPVRQVEGIEPDHAILSDKAMPVVLSDSWERCMKHGLQRQDRVLFHQSVSAVSAARVEEENHSLLSYANPEMQRLYESLGSAHWLVLCVDATGQIAGFMGNRSSAPSELQVLMQPGRTLVEDQLGTTAPGCVLAERRPVTVNRGEHFLHELRDFFCACAPILGPDGSLAGALDITGLDVRELPFANDMVSFAVRRIENSMVAAMRNCVLLRFHCDQRLVGTPFEAVLAIDSQGRISGMNRAAGQILSLPDQGAVGMSLDQLFDDGLDGVLRRARDTADPLVRIRNHAGMVSFLSVETKQRNASRSVSRVTNSSRETTRTDSFIVEDEQLKASYEKAVRVIQNGLPIILRGETGTGKEVFARALHGATRPEGPFLAINCAAIPEGLVEAELFGYADGAFTGGRKGGAPGKIEQADRGVLLLDEIGDMSTLLQSRLLRVLQSRVVTRIGTSREIPVDLAVICATHRNLEQLVAEGRFREDLYYRLNGFIVNLPPLRERNDMAALMTGLIGRWGATGATSQASALQELFTPAALDLLTAYTWPGNIRQLEQVLRALLALRSPGQAIDVADLPDPIREHVAEEARSLPKAPVIPGHTLELVELDVIRNALQEHRGNISSAAKALGISRGTLYNKLKRSEMRDGRASRRAQYSPPQQ